MQRGSEPEAADAHRVNRPNTATQVAKDAFEEMSAEEQHYLQNLAASVIDMAENGDDAPYTLDLRRFAIDRPPPAPEQP